MLIANPNRLRSALYARNLVYQSIQDAMDTVHKARYVARKRASSAQNLDALALISRHPSGKNLNVNYFLAIF
ncbi:MAG: hypothetical protein CK426_01830 [Legionella sp.]|nr:MAG: hypothetical protein CK423_00160 [Legionella sp.]PJD99546.1 MAG: hypothetical protein CK426_01830 [Legionella sp.]